MNHGSLFTGIGGFDLGFERAGMTTVWRAETDRHSNEVIEAHWPGGTNHGDVREIDPAGLASVDVLSGGFPCQDISVAGNRAGLAGARSGLWWEFARIIDTVRPPWVVIENVSGLWSSNEGRDLGAILGTLGDLGYGYGARSLDAQWFGLAQRRKRVVIVGCLGDAGRAGAVLFEPEGVFRDSPPSREEGQEVAGTIGGSSQSGGFRTTDLDNQGAYVVEEVAASLTANLGRSGSGEGDGASGLFVVVVDEAQITSKDNGSNPQVGDPAPTLNASSRPIAVNFRGRDGENVPELGGEVSAALRASQGGSDKQFVIIQDAREMETKGQNGMGVVEGDVMYTLDTASRPGVLTQDRVRRLTPTEWCRLQGFPDDWNAEGLMANGVVTRISDSQRYKQLGNAFPPVMAEWIGRRIVDASG